MLRCCVCIGVWVVEGLECCCSRRSTLCLVTCCAASEILRSHPFGVCRAKGPVLVLLCERYAWVMGCWCSWTCTSAVK